MTWWEELNRLTDGLRVAPIENSVSEMLPFGPLRREYTPNDVRALKQECAPMLDEIIGAGRWIMSESDYGYTLGLGIMDADGRPERAVYLARVDRREDVAEEDNRSYILTLDQARKMVMRSAPGANA